MKSILLSALLLMTVAVSPLLAQSTTHHVLMVVTSAGQMPDGKPTGLWLEEFAVPYLLFTEAGYVVTVASPKGGKIPVDPRSLKDAAQVYEWAEAIVRLEKTLPLSQVQPDEFVAVFLPGGHGTMFDFPDNADLKYLLGSFATQDKVIAAVCHGPAGLVGVTKADGTPLVADRMVTAFTNEEEVAVELHTVMPFMLETRLREEGGDFVAGEKWAANVQVDGRLITGQNPASSKGAAEAVIRLLGN